MSSAYGNFWPDTVDMDSVKPPVLILREQAEFLTERTRGTVVGEVESLDEPADEAEEYLPDALDPKSRIMHVHTLYLVVPALQRYRYSLLSVRHDFQSYPCVARYHPLSADIIYREDDRYRFRADRECRNEDEFVSWLQHALARPETVRVIHALLSRVKQAARS
jgi:hypothetical protein